MKILKVAKISATHHNITKDLFRKFIDIKQFDLVKTFPKFVI